MCTVNIDIFAQNILLCISRRTLDEGKCDAIEKRGLIVLIDISNLIFVFTKTRTFGTFDGIK